MSTVTIDQTALNRLLLTVEAGAHRRGWDGAPLLALVYDRADQATHDRYRGVGRFSEAEGIYITQGPYAAIQAVPTAALDGIASHAVFRLACNLGVDHPTPRTLLRFWRQPGFLGLVFGYEAWVLEATEEERKTVGNRRFADTPGAVEARQVVAATVTGSLHAVTRIRGRKPQTHLGDYTGSIPESLHYAVAAIVGAPLPPAPQPPSGWVWPSETATGADRG